MKAAHSIFALALCLSTSCLCSFGATVIAPVHDTQLNPLTTTLTFTPVKQVIIAGGGLSVGGAVTSTTTNGNLRQILDGGIYTVSLPAGWYRDSFQIAVPNNTNTYNITDLMLRPLVFVYTNSIVTNVSFFSSITVTGTLHDLNIVALNTVLTFQPVKDVLISSGGLSVGNPLSLTTTNGAFSTLLDAGRYTVSLPLMWWREPFTISVPNGTNTYNIAALMNPPATFIYTNNNAVTNELIAAYAAESGHATNADNATHATSASAGWPVQWPYDSITNAPWLTILAYNIGWGALNTNILSSLPYQSPLNFQPATNGGPVAVTQLPYVPQPSNANSQAWSAITTGSKQDALTYQPATNGGPVAVSQLPYVPQASNANSQAWSGITTASKQDALTYQPATNLGPIAISQLPYVPQPSNSVLTQFATDNLAGGTNLPFANLNFAGWTAGSVTGNIIGYLKFTNAGTVIWLMGTTNANP